MYLIYPISCLRKTDELNDGRTKVESRRNFVKKWHCKKIGQSDSGPIAEP